MQFQDDQPPNANDATLVAPRAQQVSARLILKRADGQLKEYGLDKDEVSIGRLASNDVALPDDRSVSRRHAVIRRSNVGYVIEDQQSNNGTYVDGEKILYPFVLHNGQSIKIGSNELTFTLVTAAARPTAAGQESQVPEQAPAPAAQEHPFNQPIPQPMFDAPPQSAFNAPPAIEQPPAAFPQPPGAPAFQQPPPGPAFQSAQPFGQPPAPEQPFQAAPAFGAPPQPAGQPFPPTPGYQVPSQPAAPAAAGMVICQSCGQSTMANKAFCLNCGASLAAQNAAVAPAPSPSAPFGSPSGFGGPTAGPQPGPQPWPPQPQQQQQQAWPPQPQPQQQQPWPQPPQAQQPPAGPQAWPPQPQPQQPQPQSQPQGWPGQPGQFGAAPQAAPAGPFDGTVFFPKGLRPLQTSDIKVRLATLFAAPSGLQPGTTITLRIWSAAQDAFYFAGPGITLRVPAPGGVEEGSLQVTPLRPTAPGATDQILFMVVDANTGQPLHPTPVASEVVISYQPTPPFDGPGSARLPI